MDDLTALRIRISALEGRLDRIERATCIAIAVAAVASLLIGLVVPFLQASEPTDDPEDSITLLPAVFGIASAGDGPFKEEAIVAGVLLGGFVLVVLATALGAVLVLSEPTRRRTVFARTAAIVLLVGCCGTWLLVLILAGRSDDRASAFSPATLCMTIGAALTLVVARLGAKRS